MIVILQSLKEYEMYTLAVCHMTGRAMYKHSVTQPVVNAIVSILFVSLLI